MQKNGDPLSRHVKNENVTVRIARTRPVNLQRIWQVGMPPRKVSLQRTDGRHGWSIMSTAICTEQRHHPRRESHEANGTRKCLADERVAWMREGHRRIPRRQHRELLADMK